MKFNYHTIESRIGFMQAFPFNGYNKLRDIVTSLDSDGYYISSNYMPFCFIFDN